VLAKRGGRRGIADEGLKEVLGLEGYPYYTLPAVCKTSAEVYPRFSWGRTAGIPLGLLKRTPTENLPRF